jgi:hypothetical protein
MSETCNHKWIDMEDGSRDRFCVRCSKKAMQAVISLRAIEVNVITDKALLDKLEKDLYRGMMVNRL